MEKEAHQGDLALWSALLEYQTRMNGDSGARKVWRSFWGRKALHDVESPLAPIFWQTILEAAVRLGDPKFLSDVYLYGEWMYHTYGVKWPRFYSTVITHFLKTRQHQEVLRWHLRLIPNFYPGHDELVEILKQFGGERELYHAFTLQSLYILSPSRQLYDKLVPYFYERGESASAIAWRDILIQRDDAPLLPVPVRPFLRYLQGYFPKRPLHPREAAALNQDSDLSQEVEEPPKVTREVVNRIHGGTFGISVKNYNDALGAKWFASSWVGLDTAIAGVAALGVEAIGPLSLQSIALREKDCAGVSKRIQQLQNHGIAVADSNYFRILLHFIEMMDDELLLDLLQSDFHPDVFNDLQLLTELLESMLTSNDWRTYRLLLTARVVILKKTTREIANAVLRVCFLNQDREGFFRALDDMRAMKVGIDRDQANLIFKNLYRDVPVPSSEETVSFYLAICMRFVSMDIPVPVACWSELIRSLGERGKVDEMEALCIELVSLLTTSRSSRPGFMPVHLDDAPEPMKAPLLGVENLLGVYVPEDLTTFAQLHPLRRLFDYHMLVSIIRWTFRATLRKPATGRSPLAALAAGPRHHRGRRLADYYCARGVRLIRVMREAGLLVRRKEVERAVMPRLVDLYGTEVPTKHSTLRARRHNPLSLADMKTLLDRAWGGDDDNIVLLPPLPEVRAAVLRRGRRKTHDNLRYLRLQGKRPFPSSPPPLS